jgi:uncharacterized protein
MAEFLAPGVFIEEVPLKSHPVEGVSTSATSFVGMTERGPIDVPISIQSFSEFERHFGGLWQDSTLSFAIHHFFENGGTRAHVVRVAKRAGANAAKTARITLANGEVFEAASAGGWGQNLKLSIDLNGVVGPLFNLTVTDDAASRRAAHGRAGSGVTERFEKLSVDPHSAQFASTVLAQQSALLRAVSLRAAAPAAQANLSAPDGSGKDGVAIGSGEVTAETNRASKTGLFALDKVSFNLLCIPPYTPSSDLNAADWQVAASYCLQRRAFFIADAPSAWTFPDADKKASAIHLDASQNAAVYFPRLLAKNPLDGDKLTPFAPCGAVAGIMSRTDASRGVWKAPAGTEATVNGAAGLSPDGFSEAAAAERLTAAGVNLLRAFPGTGIVVWAARTFAAWDSASDWKYVPVRRLALYIEESLYRGTYWVVFENNDEKTWVQVRQRVEDFLLGLFRQGAFQGTKPEQAFYVRCDRTTMTQDDIDNGRLIILVGIAPVKPAEFVIFRLQQFMQK